MVTARIPTDLGEFRLFLFSNTFDNKEHLAFVMGAVEGQGDVLARVHSECFTGEVLHSQRCDCGEQLDQSLVRIAEEERGILLYMRQEGRGIGLLEKLRAYNLQDEGYDTVDANLILGHQADSRNYSVSAAMLRTLGVSSIRLLTNNPAKIDELKSLGIAVTARVALTPTVNSDNERYLRTKVARMRHLLDLPNSRANDTKPDEPTS
ncbi:MAG: GTP cyclohydrolase II [Chloroflexi bacterium]|nr:GTP cyclohydrolase II [Chloroflexota bacterium]